MSECTVCVCMCVCILICACVCLVDRGSEGKEGGLERRGYICEWSLLAVRALAELKLALCFFLSAQRVNQTSIKTISQILNVFF